MGFSRSSQLSLHFHTLRFRSKAHPIGWAYSNGCLILQRAAATPLRLHFPVTSPDDNSTLRGDIAEELVKCLAALLVTGISLHQAGRQVRSPRLSGSDVWSHRGFESFGSKLLPPAPRWTIRLDEAMASWRLLLICRIPTHRLRGRKDAERDFPSCRLRCRACL